MSKTTKKLCYIALLVAVYVLLSMTFTIKTGNLEITFKSLPVVVAALLFGPAAGGLTALLGEFLCQVMMYGLMPTTILWLLPPVVRGLVIGCAAKFFWKSGRLLESRPVTCLKNKELAEDYRKKGEELLAKALPLADQIYQNVLSQM